MASMGTSISVPPSTRRAVRAPRPDESADRAAGPGLGTGLHPATGEDEADDHGRRVEVGDRLDAGLGHE